MTLIKFWETFFYLRWDILVAAGYSNKNLFRIQISKVVVVSY